MADWSTLAYYVAACRDLLFHICMTGIGLGILNC